MRELKKVPGVLVPPRTDTPLKYPLLNYHILDASTSIRRGYNSITDNANETFFLDPSNPSHSLVAPLTLPESAVEVWRC